MDTSALIARLAAEAAPVKPWSPLPGAAVTALAVAGLTALGFVVLGGRPDLAEALARPAPWIKALAPLAAGALAAWVALGLARPAAEAPRGLGAAAPALLVVSGLTALSALALPAEAAAAALAPRDGLVCVAATLVAALGAGAVLARAVRSGAPTRPRLAAGAVALAAAGFGLFAYQWSCPHDGWRYLLTWYPLAAGLAALAVRAVAGPVLRW